MVNLIPLFPCTSKKHALQLRISTDQSASFNFQPQTRSHDFSKVYKTSEWYQINARQTAYTKPHQQNADYKSLPTSNWSKLPSILHNTKHQYELEQREKSKTQFYVIKNIKQNEEVNQPTAWKYCISSYSLTGIESCHMIIEKSIHYNI